MKNILIPISFSDTSKKALHDANLIAKQYHATLSLMHCYAEKEFDRVYDFGAKDYESGIKQMLLDLYKNNIGGVDKQPFRLLAFSGSVSDVITKISHKYDLLVLGRNTGFQSNLNKWFSDKTFYFTTKSLCPVLLLPTKKKRFSFSKINNIWHIQRKDTEKKLIEQELLKFKVDPKLVVSKSLQQKKFKSAFWRNIVKYTEDHNEVYLKKISESYGEEHIDLLILVNHKKGMFERFLKDDVFQIISQFDIPILVLQSKEII